MRDPWIRVSAPGLPPWPALWFDPERRLAFVTARMPTWRSHIYAFRATQLSILGVMASFSIWLWRRWDIGHQDGEALFFYLFALMIVYPFIAFLLRCNLPEFLARRVFSTKTTLWFTPQFIRFKSALYAEPVMVWRSWNQRPVRCRFIVQQNREALKFAGAGDPKQQVLSRRIQESTLIEMIIATGQQVQFTQEPGFDASLRSIPVTESCQERSNRLTTVFTAAVALTSGYSQQPPTRTAGQATEGTDIDLE